MDSLPIHPGRKRDNLTGWLAKCARLHSSVYARMPGHHAARGRYFIASLGERCLYESGGDALMPEGHHQPQYQGWVDVHRIVDATCSRRPPDAATCASLHRVAQGTWANHQETGILACRFDRIIQQESTHCKSTDWTAHALAITRSSALMSTRSALASACVPKHLRQTSLAHG